MISLVLLALAGYALYLRALAGVWRKTYVGCATASLYLNTFVLIVQMFQKFPAFHDLAPTQSEPAFTVTQGVLLVVFIALGVIAAGRFSTISAG